MMVQNLVLFGFSGYDTKQVKALSTMLGNLEGLEIVLMQDGVIGSTASADSGPFSELLSKKITLFSLSEDLQARGMDVTKLVNGITEISYADLVDKIDAAKKLISWL